MQDCCKALIAVACAVAAATGCDSAHANTPTHTNTPGGATDGGRDGGVGATAEGGGSVDPDPVITTATRSALEGIRYDSTPPTADPSNRVGDDAAARAFGQRLFFDTSLSGRLLERDNDGSGSTLGVAGEAGRVSCAGCHIPRGGFVDIRSPHHQISLAAEWSKRKTPTLLEAAFAPLYNWDGRRDSIWGQAMGVMESAGEFNSGRLFVAEQIFRLQRQGYEALFGPMPALDDATRFPQLDSLQAGCDAGPVATAPCRGKPGDKADYDGMTADAQLAATTVMVNAAKSIAAYVRQLRCGPSRFEQWLSGDPTALSRSEQRGAALFVGAGKCVSCHSGPNLTDGKFHNVGVRPATVAVAFTDTNDPGASAAIPLLLNDPMNTKGAFSDGDRGVLPAAVGPELAGAFRTPTLRCIAHHPSFMHTAQDSSLEVVVQFFNRGGDPAGFPGTNELSPLGLGDREQADLVAFVAALEGPGPDAALLAAPGN